MLIFWRRNTAILYTLQCCIDIFAFFLLIWKISQLCSIVDVFLSFLCLGIFLRLSSGPLSPTEINSWEALFLFAVWHWCHLVQPVSGIHPTLNWELVTQAKQRKRGICSGKGAAHAVSAASNVSCSTSPQWRLQQMGPVIWFWLWVCLPGLCWFILHREGPLNTSVPQGFIQELLPSLFTSFLLGNPCHF